jgi:hypothetical protein
LKAGVYFEKDLIISPSGTDNVWMGSVDFSTDASNLLTANNPYANAMMGNFKEYTEGSNRIMPVGLSFNIDWYLQDSWKVTKRLTLELGLRVAWWDPYRQPDGNVSSFALSRYDPTSLPTFFHPTLVNGVRLALNPVTGQTGPAALIGAFVPGTSNPANGMVTARDPNYPSTFVESFGELPEPRFGLAYDLFGNGKTALRLGFGDYNGMIRNEPVSNNPPLLYNPATFYGNLNTFLNSTGYLFPSSVTAYPKNMRSPAIYNLTFGIQQSVGLSTVVEAKYVGVLGRHLEDTRNLNEVPYGAEFLPANQDPTTGSPLPDNFFRPFPGYGSITYTDAASASSYHSLVLAANRRFVHGLQFGASYVWSKSMGYGTSLPMYQSYQTWAYGKVGTDQTNRVVLNYTYDIPAFSRVWQSAFSRNVLDHWQLSGITTFASGTPQGITLTTSTGANLVGGGDGQRVNVTGNPNLSHGDRGILEMFNPTVFALPPKGNAGDAPPDVFRGPGFNDWDVTLFKSFPLKSEQRSVQFRWEFYNFFNHTQFSSVNNTARFDASGNQINGQFGQATGARNPRIMQGSLRFRF